VEIMDLLNQDIWNEIIKITNLNLNREDVFESANKIINKDPKKVDLAIKIIETQFIFRGVST
tara:strand:+ start:1290 stop:1475 length:186 start_codon:yes stop_codon:yes gene_type:complete